MTAQEGGYCFKIYFLVLKELEQGWIVLAASPARIHILGLSKCQFKCFSEYNDWAQWAAAAGGGCNVPPPTNLAVISGNGPQFSAFSVCDRPALALLPPSHSFWPTLCSLLPTKEWAEICAVQKLLDNRKETSDRATSRWPIPFAESLPFILNLLQIREGNRCCRRLCLQEGDYGVSSHVHKRRLTTQT